MKSKVLTVVISRPVQAVFEFTTNPMNTPKWIDFIEEERTDRWPPQVGTTYVNRRSDGSEACLRVTAWEPPTKFRLANSAVGLVVEYSYEALSDEACLVRYVESVEGSQLPEVFTQGHLDRLKAIMEGID